MLLKVRTTVTTETPVSQLIGFRYRHAMRPCRPDKEVQWLITVLEQCRFEVRVNCNPPTFSLLAEAFKGQRPYGGG